MRETDKRSGAHSEMPNFDIIIIIMVGATINIVKPFKL